MLNVWPKIPTDKTAVTDATARCDAAACVEVPSYRDPAPYGTALTAPDSSVKAAIPCRSRSNATRRNAT